MKNHNYILKTKTDKALFIASILFQKRVTILNWKVKDLLKKKSKELDSLVRMAENALVASKKLEVIS